MSEITNVTIRKTKEGRVKAFADVTLNGDFVVKSVRLCENDKGLYIQMPTAPKYEKDGKDVYPQVAHPITTELRTAMTNAVIDAYNKAE